MRKRIGILKDSGLYAEGEVRTGEQEGDFVGFPTFWAVIKIPFSTREIAERCINRKIEERLGEEKEEKEMEVE